MDNYETLSSYKTQEARDILQQTDVNVQQILAKIAENNITITSADIFYGVSGVEKATSLIQSFKATQAKLEKLIALDAPQIEITQTVDMTKSILKNYINVIKSDRLVIKNKIAEILNINS